MAGVHAIKHFGVTPESVCGIRSRVLQWDLPQNVTCGNCLRIINNMEGTNVSDIQARIDYHIRELERLEALAGKQMRYLDFLQNLDNNAVIKFDYAFNEGGIYYSYAAIKVDGEWYTTGPRSPKGYTDAELSDWFAKAASVRNLRVMRAGKKFE